MDKSYQVRSAGIETLLKPDLKRAALGLLNSRRRLTRPAGNHGSGPLSALPNETSFRGSPSIVGIKDWLQELGHMVLSCLMESFGIVH